MFFPNTGAKLCMLCGVISEVFLGAFMKPKTAIQSFLSKTLDSSTFTWRQILNLTFPSMLDSMSITFIGVLITALISENGESSVAAVSLVGPIINLITCMFSGIAAGGTVVVAQYRGAGDETRLRRCIGGVLWLTVSVGVAACMPFLLFPRQILAMLYRDADSLVMEKAVVYLAGCVWTVIVFTLYTAAFSILRGLGEAKKCLHLSVVINVAYLVFSFLFLNILHQDVRGSVRALMLARVIGAAAALVSLLIHKAPIKLKVSDIFSFDRRVLSATLKVSIPLGLEQIFASCGGLVSQMYLIRLGTTAVAVNAIVNALQGFLYSPAASVSNVAVAVVGRCAGAEKREEAYLYGKRCCQMSLFMLTAACLIFYPLLPVLLTPYRLTGEASSMTAKILVAAIPFLLICWSYSNVMPNVLRAGSDTVFPSAVSLAVMWTVSIGMGYLLAIPAGLGLWGTWLAAWGAWTVRAGIFLARFRSRKWLRGSVARA